jgi:hypothetical protein
MMKAIGGMEFMRGTKRLSRLILLFCILFVFLGPCAIADDWQLVYEDDFEREKVGPAWVITGKGEPVLNIINGELVGGGTRGFIQFAYPVRGDQKVVFEGRWVEGTGRSMVQFGGLLKGSTFYGQHSGIGLIHGRRSNTTNVVEFLSWNGRIARNKGPLPEAGKKYTFEAVVEGTHTYLKRDGKMIIEADLPFALEGYPFDRVLLYANENRIRFDSVKIYRKGTEKAVVPSVYTLPVKIDVDGLPKFAGDDPEGKIAAVVAMNQSGKPQDALKLAGKIADPGQKLSALMMLANDYMFQPYSKLCNVIVKHLKRHPKLAPKQADGALSLIKAAQMMTRATKTKNSQCVGYFVYLRARLDRSHPFYNAILMNFGKHLIMGEGGLPEIKEQAGRHAILELFLSDLSNPLLRMYLGENVLWGKEYIDTDPDAPHWAKVVRESHARLLHIIDWWVEKRQKADGQFGGGWGDDVETLRFLGPMLILSDVSKVSRTGMKKVVDGAWKAAEGGLELGYSKRLWDVEHSAEPTADTQPLMLMFEPDNPLYVERNRKLLPLVTDLWTHLTPEGYRYFKSVYISATKIDDAPERRANLPYHTRAFKGLTWLAWHGNYPDVEKVWLELADGWVEATMREAQGKLRGVVPASVDYKTGALGAGGGTWYRPGLGWSYYNWPASNHPHVFNLFLSAYKKTGNKKYMEPIFASLQQALKYKPVKSYVPPKPAAASGEVPSHEYQRYMLHRLHASGFYATYLLAYRMQSGDTQFDAYLKDTASLETIRTLNKYQITGDEKPVINALEKLLVEKLRYNLPMWTSELKRTDKLGRLPSHKELYSVMTGAITRWGDSGWPSHAVTWSHPNADFAAIVRSERLENVNIRFYSFDTKNSDFGLKFWLLPKGEYVITWKATDMPKQTQEFDFTKRGQIVNLKLPPKREILIQVAPINR